MYSAPSPSSQYMFNMHSMAGRAMGREYSPAPRTPQTSRFANNFIHPDGDGYEQPNQQGYPNGNDQWAHMHHAIQGLVISSNEFRESMVVMRDTVHQSAERIALVESKLTSCEAEASKFRREAESLDNKQRLQQGIVDRLQAEYGSQASLIDNLEERLNSLGQFANKTQIEALEASIATLVADNQETKEELTRFKTLVETLHPDTRSTHNTHIPPSHPSTSTPLPDSDRDRRICVFKVPFIENKAEMAAAYTKLQGDICDLANIPHTCMPNPPTLLGIPYMRDGIKLHSLKMEVENRFNAYSIYNCSYRIWRQLRVSVSEDLSQQEQDIKRGRMELFRKLQKDMPEARFRFRRSDIMYNITMKFDESNKDDDGRPALLDRGRWLAFNDYDKYAKRGESDKGASANVSFEPRVRKAPAQSESREVAMEEITVHTSTPESPGVNP
jgi:hypothetical protein